MKESPILKNNDYRNSIQSMEVNMSGFFMEDFNTGAEVLFDLENSGMKEFYGRVYGDRDVYAVKSCCLTLYSLILGKEVSCIG